MAVLEVLYLSRIINLLPQYVACYIAGYYFAKRQMNQVSGEKDIRILTIITTVAALILLPLRLYVQYGIYILPLPGWDMIKTQITEWHHSLLGVALFFILLQLFKKKEVKYNNLLKFTDKYSYCIYLVHQVFIMGTFSLLQITDFVVINIFW